VDSSFFDFTINIADVALAFVGVGGGAYAGGRAAQVARHRADHRLKLLVELIPEILSLDGPRSARLDHFELARTVVQLLPYPERALWRAAEARIDDEFARLLASDGEAAEAATDALIDVQIHNERNQSRIEEKVAREEDRVRLSFALIDGSGEISAALGSLATYLEWKLRPTLWRRWRARTTAAQLRLSWRPSPWRTVRSDVGSRSTG